MQLINYANRGRTLENLIIAANTNYRARGQAVIHKVPTAWMPIRNGKGKIVSAKVEKKAAVDFMGVVKTPDGSLAVAFDAKEVAKGDRWPLSRLEPHQYEYLRDHAACGGFSFVLIAFWESDRFFVLPFPELERRWTAWKNKTGPASVRAGDGGLVEVRFLEYLNFFDRGEQVAK